MEEDEEEEEDEDEEEEEDDVEPEKRWEMERESIAMASLSAELQVRGTKKSCVGRRDVSLVGRYGDFPLMIPTHPRDGRK